MDIFASIQEERHNLMVDNSKSIRKRRNLFTIRHSIMSQKTLFFGLSRNFNDEILWWNSVFQNAVNIWLYIWEIYIRRVEAFGFQWMLSLVCLCVRQYKWFCSFVKWYFVQVKASFWAVFVTLIKILHYIQNCNNKRKFRCCDNAS
jgi:hypothetical protein